MSCLNTTGPVNIDHPDNIIYCKETCKLSYNFKSTLVSVANKGNCLVIEPSDKNSTPVTYSSTDAGDCKTGGEGKYSVQEVRVYCATNPGGSLHKYDDKRATGEVIIYLNNTIGAGNLIICIPIISSNGSLPKATSQLTNIIQNSLSTANSSDESNGPLRGVELDLNYFIPKKAGFYSYTATLPYPPCTNCINYIVYTPQHGIYLSKNTITKLTEIIERLTPPIHSSDQPTIGYAYNKSGATQGGDSDDTYMDCQPVGEDGEVLISENKDGIPSIISGLSPEAQAQFKSAVLIISLILLLVGFLCLILFGLPIAMRGLGWEESAEKVSALIRGKNNQDKTSK